MTRLACVLSFLGLILPASAQQKSDAPVSFHKDIVPIFKASCLSCHNANKKKGKLDMTTYEGLRKGGKEGSPFVTGDPEKSLIVKMISGKEPEMPEDGDPLKPGQIALIARWIKEGAKEDAPAPAARISAPEKYTALPVVSKLAYSPDGKLLAAPGFHEVLLHNTDGSGIAARLACESSRIEGMVFSADGKQLAVSGGSPAQFGEIQVWDVAAKALVKSFKVTSDLLYGISLSPDAQRIAFTCTDKSVRIYSVADAKELMKFDGHTEWVFGTTFTLDGKRLVTGGKDRACKLLDAANGQFIDDINKLLEPVLCIARHPKKDEVLYGGALGTPRIYRISDNQGRTAANNDTNLVRQFERQPGAVQAVAWSPDGALIAVGGVNPEARVYKADGVKVATLGGHGGAVFALAFHPDGKTLATGAWDGQVRIFEAATGKLVTSFVPVPVADSPRKSE